MQFQDVPNPQLQADEVIIKVNAVGICGSDMHAYHGHDPRRNPGLVMGHEVAGTIFQSSSPRFSPGQRVTVNPLILCGHCHNCISGNGNLCENRTMIGMTRPGAYAEYMSIPAASVIALPDTLSDRDATLTEPVATVIHALKISQRSLHRPIQECKVLILGGGTIGLLMALLLEAYGVRHLHLAEVNALRRASCAEYIRAQTFDPLALPPADASYDYVIDAVGRKETRNMGIAALKPLGTLMHIGLQDWASEIDIRKVTLAEIAILGTYCYTMSDLHTAVTALEEGILGDLAWVETYPLHKGAEAFALLHEGKTRASKIVLLP